MMYTFMNSDLSRHFKNLIAMEIVDELKNSFSAQVRIVRFECPNGFLSLKMKENSSLEQHMRIMHEIHHRLVLVWNHEINDGFAIGGVIRSFSPASRIMSETRS